MNTKTYTFRPSAVQKTTTLTIEESYLSVDEQEKQARKIDYKDILCLNPKFMGSKNYPNMYHTLLELKGSNRFTIKNHNYSGMMKMDDQSKSYVPFVLALHLAIAKANPNAVFKKGYPKSTYFFYLGIFWLTMIAVALFVVLFLVGNQYLYAILGTVGFWVLFRQMKKFKRANKPEVYTVDNVPDHLMPEIKSNSDKND